VFLDREQVSKTESYDGVPRSFVWVRQALPEALLLATVALFFLSGRSGSRLNIRRLNLERS
jgi:hypothetical protein